MRRKCELHHVDARAVVAQRAAAPAALVRQVAHALAHGLANACGSKPPHARKE